MTALWQAAAIALLAPLAVACWAVWRGQIGERLAALQTASTIAVLELTALSYACDQPATIDLALTLALLSLPASLLFALFHERWL